MPPKTTYGRQTKASKAAAERLFSELPQSPLRKPPPPTGGEATSPAKKSASPAIVTDATDIVADLTEQLSEIRIVDKKKKKRPEPIKKQLPPPPSTKTRRSRQPAIITAQELAASAGRDEDTSSELSADADNSGSCNDDDDESPESSYTETETPPLRVISWDDVCPAGDRIEKIAEASYAEVYRVTNDHGTSIIKAIRLHSPIRAQTKAQQRAGLVDEQPHAEADLNGELQISEWLAEIPGFVVYKERYVVEGRASRRLLDTHQAFQRRMKRLDPGRAQFYPSPSRYLDGTCFLVVELGDAGVALEDWNLTTESQLWDIFFLVAIALARAENIAMFEHRDLHEGNVCIRQVCEPQARPADAKDGYYYGYSGLEITILDYGLSRAEDLSIDFAKPVSNDLEADLGIFTSTHAPQCAVYRQMRSFLLRGDGECLPPAAHTTPYAEGIDGPISWDVFAPYTNVLWLAYLYAYLVGKFEGGGGGESKARPRNGFGRLTREMWRYLDPDAGDDEPCFSCAADVVGFAVEAGWIGEAQLAGDRLSMMEREESIMTSRDDGEDETLARRRSERRRCQKRSVA